jgi:hypothetical protein
VISRKAVGREIGHADWRAEHVRFVTDGDDIRIAAIYDWDSLQKRREPALVGVAAACFCANWAGRRRRSRWRRH